jgi:two-component system NarL family sensor kinase
MWIRSRHSGKAELSHDELELLVLQRTAALQALSRRLLSVQDEERRRVARDLHDSTGQTLTALKIRVVLLQEQLEQHHCTCEVMSDIAALADQVLREIRTMSYLLHPPLLDELGFTSAAHWFVDDFAKRSGIKVSLDLATDLERLPVEVETALFRVLQGELD